MEYFNLTKLTHHYSRFGLHIDFSKDELEVTHQIIGKNVKKIREANDLTQLQLSQMMGLKSVSLVSAAEPCSNGKHFNIEHLYKIAKICNINMSDFFNGIDTSR